MPMKRREVLRALAGVVLVVGGLLAALPTPYRERAFLIPANGCNLETDLIEPKMTAPHGVVVLLHGLAANKKIMSYLARAFAAQELRVFVPDLPGQGHSRIGFSPEREQQCSDDLLRELYARKLAEPKTTIIAGHSMGGALALNAAAHVGAAGVIAISPAPMRAAHGASPEDLFFGTTPAEVRNALVISGGWELESRRGNAQDLVAGGSAGSQYLLVPEATHVSLLFDPRAARASQSWAAHLLGLPVPTSLPSYRSFLAFLCGFIGLLLIAGPFLRELCGTGSPVEHVPANVLRRVLVVARVAAVSTFAVIVLGGGWNPARAIGLFEGDYLAGFAVIAGVPLLALYWRRLVRDRRPLLTPGQAPGGDALKGAPARVATEGSASRAQRETWKAVVVAAFGAMAIFVLVTGWFEVTISEAWLNAPRWWRFPFLFLAFLPYLWAEELLLGGMEALSGWRRLAAGVGLRAIAWLALMAGIFLLHSGEVLLALLVPYFALLTIFQRRGMDIVRNGTGSAAAAAVFGAILLAGFCLAIFPIR
jgi:pimeloyl-ACP methyl ester carboxylesterase